MTSLELHGGTYDGDKLFTVQDGKRRMTVTRLRQTLAARQDLHASGAPDADRAAAHANLAEDERAVLALPEEYRRLIHEREMLAKAHARQCGLPPSPPGRGQG